MAKVTYLDGNRFTIELSTIMPDGAFRGVRPYDTFTYEGTRYQVFSSESFFNGSQSYLVDARVELVAKSNDGMVSLLGKMVEDAGEGASEELLTQYEEALLTQDRNLAIKEAQRTDILGLPALEDSQYCASLEYSEDRQLAIEARREKQLIETRELVLGGVAARLALLAGENVATNTQITNVTEIALPEYFDIVAEQVTEIAAKRQSITEKRLAIFRPSYPEAEAQQEAKAEVLIGVGIKGNFNWFCGKYEASTQSVGIGAIPAEIKEKLNEEEYLSVIEAGYNVMTFDALEQVDINDQLGEALDKYVKNVFPGQL